MTTNLLGYTEDGEPIWALYGSDDADDSEEGEETEDEETEGEEEDDEADDGKKHPPSSKGKKATPPAKKAAAPATNGYKPPSEAEWNRTRAALKKANLEQQATRKAALEKARKEGEDDAAEKAREEATDEAHKVWHPRAVKAEAKAALAGMGCKNPARLIKLIDTDAVTWQDNETMGLEEQLNTLKDEWPELFTTTDNTTNGKTKQKEVAGPRKQGAAAGSTKKDEGGEKKDNRGAARIAARLGGSSA